MPDDKQPTDEQARLAKEVLEGKRQITASAPKIEDMADKIPDDVKAKALQYGATIQASAEKIPADARAANEAQPRPEAAIAQEKIAQMAKTGHDAASITKAASKDDFTKG